MSVFLKWMYLYMDACQIVRQCLQWNKVMRDVNIILIQSRHVKVNCSDLGLHPKFDLHASLINEGQCVGGVCVTSLK